MEYVDLTHESQSSLHSHRLLMLDFEARRRASVIDVPTLPNDVRVALRSLGEPVRLFGEDLSAVRDRLRVSLARKEVWDEHDAGEERVDEENTPSETLQVQQHSIFTPKPRHLTGETLSETTYTHASSDLITSREFICNYSLQSSHQRLDAERGRRRGMILWTKMKKRARFFSKDVSIGNEKYFADNELKDDAALVKDLDETCEQLYGSIRSHVLEGSQYGDVRPLSALCTSSNLFANGCAGKLPNLIATGSWSGGLKIWNGTTDLGIDGRHSNPRGEAALDLLGAKSIVHEDRIMGVAMRPYLSSTSLTETLTLVASASIDLTAKLCRIRPNDPAATRQITVDKPSSVGLDRDNLEKKQRLRYKIEECAHFKGHAARLCSVAFHPSGLFVATTSFDHTWRLWDLESSSMLRGKELLLQDGHAREVYGVGFHPDGSLVATTDFGGVVQCWDLRTGKSACHFLGHAKRVICSEFSPNGLQLATAGDDGTIKIWDLRRRRLFASIPAHTHLITQLKFAHGSREQNGEFLASSSFDGTGKIWSARDWKLLTTLQGHEGKVMGIDVLDGSNCGIVTCGFDKTLKLWK